jgi:citrate synthase
MAESNPDILYEIKKEDLESGLRGIPVGYCTTSTVNPISGLFYSDKTIEEISPWSPERVIYLLYYGKEGTEKEIEEFTNNLNQRALCSPETIKHIKQLPKEGHPMKLFCAALLIAGMLEGKNDYREDCLNLIAKIPEITAAVINYHAGWGGIKASRPELGYMENFTQMLNVPNSDHDQLTQTFRLFNVLHYDHGGGNLSTFVGKAVASGLEDMYGSISAAMCALAGPRHGKANQDSLEFVESLITTLGENTTPEKLEAELRRRLESKQLIFGFGHAVLRVEDPRAKVLYDKAEKKFLKNQLVKMALLLREVAPKILHENPKISDPYPNVDAISGVLLSATGFPYPEYFTVLFGLSRVVGIAIQIVYERCEAREGKGLPIVRPKYLYRSRGEEQILGTPHKIE